VRPKPKLPPAHLLYADHHADSAANNIRCLRYRTTEPVRRSGGRQHSENLRYEVSDAGPS
jgi:hypothetical protein